MRENRPVNIWPRRVEYAYTGACPFSAAVEAQGYFLRTFSKKNIFQILLYRRSAAIQLKFLSKGAALHLSSRDFPPALYIIVALNLAIPLVRGKNPPPLFPS